MDRPDSDSSTNTLGGEPPSPKEKAALPLPKMIGRYRVERLLGTGGFGDVYLAHDEQLHRLVAIKVLHPKLASLPQEAEPYLAEARTAAALDHPNIVPVYDVGSTAEYPCYIVSKYIEGTTLADRMREFRLSWTEAAQIVAVVAEALHYAHTRGVVHRDVKPGNILIDVRGTPFVTDFGVALRDADPWKAPRFVGTPAYMSPEHVRGEGHRIDGRSDVFSLGVLLYELLTGRRPFHAETRASLFELIANHDPCPPRQLDDSIPRELERICLKALAKRATDRYTTAADMADDLREFLYPRSWDEPTPAETAKKDAATSGGPAHRAASTSFELSPSPADSFDAQLPKIVPKGLRSFDTHDADFFLELLPGARDRAGLPESIRFWKSRIEAADPQATFFVGLMYGPSGCGKTSLVQAGLLPRLAPHIVSVYVEAAPHDTETRLLTALRKRCTGLPGNLSLKDLIAALRRGHGVRPGHKVLIVLDQFEQWLHACDGQDAELVQALRHCDGEHVQCILMVRADFWLAVTRFLRELEVTPLEGQNAALVDLFDLEHAKKVLAAFGRALGRLPESPAPLNTEQQGFLQHAVLGLAEGDKVIPIRLALFAELMKNKPWTLASLKKAGLGEGVEVAFLEDTFASSTAPPPHRYHHQAAMAVLRALLPEPGAEIKGATRSRQELREVSGYYRLPHDFEGLMRLLDGELRLITPVAPHDSPPLQGGARGGPLTAEDSDPQTEARAGSYQLTHDYLVRPLRIWLARYEQANWKGRIRLRVAELTSLWKTSRDRRFLPSLWEFCLMALAVSPKQLQPVEQEFVRSASRYHGIRCTVFMAAVFLFAAMMLIGTRQRHVQSLVERVATAAPEDLHDAIARLQPYQGDAIPILRKYVADERAALNCRLYAAYALCTYGSAPREFLFQFLDVVPPSEAQNVIAALLPDKDAVVEEFHRREATPGDQARLRLAIVALHLGGLGPAKQLLEFRPDPADRTDFIWEYTSWNGDLAQLPALLLNSDDPALQSGLCKALGRMSPRPGNDETHQALVSALRVLYRQSPHSAVHSSARFALRQWGENVPQPDELRPLPALSQWFVNKLGMTLVKVRPREESAGEKTQPSKTLFMCDSEVSVELFDKFVKAAGKVHPKPALPMPVDRERSPTGDCPAQNVIWTDALIFCNWLSMVEGRKPCYRLDEQAATPVWSCDFEADGYRLPTLEEWTTACQAGTRTTFFFGNDASRCGDYAFYQKNSPTRTWPCGTKLPNPWGLFDMYGNVAEWCWDKDAPIDGKDMRVYRGGSIISLNAEYLVHPTSSNRIDLPAMFIGIRVVCRGYVP